MPLANEITIAGKFLRESLTRYETEFLDTVYPDYWGYEGKYHNAKSGLPFGVKEVGYSRIDYTGRAVNYGGKATTLPLANFGINMDKNRTMVGVLAADWTWQELAEEAAAQSNPHVAQINVVREYSEALDKGLREWMHIRALFGDPSVGFTGLFNNPFVEVIDVNFASFLGLSGTGAAGAAYDWIRSQLSQFRKDSKLTAENCSLLTSEDVLQKLTTRYADASSDGTPYGTLTGAGAAGTGAASVREINVVPELSITQEMINDYALEGFTPNQEWMLCYEESPDNMIRQYADIETFLAGNDGMLDDGLTFRKIGMCATTEVQFKRPYRARLYRFAKS